MVGPLARRSPQHGIKMARIAVSIFVACCTVAAVAAIPDSATQTLIAGLRDPLLLVLDVAGGKMYFKVTTGTIAHFDDHVQVANLNGSQLKDYSGALPANLSMNTHYAYDRAAGKKYYTVALGHKIHSVMRANLNGSDPDTLVPNLPWPTNIVLDVKRGKMYWIDTGFPTYFPDSVGGTINRANLDGGKHEVIIKGNASWSVPGTIVLDVDAGKMFLNGQGHISLANLDGSGFEDIIATSDTYHLGQQIALDKPGGWLYYSEGCPVGMPADGVIKRVAIPPAGNWTPPPPPPTPPPPPPNGPTWSFHYGTCGANSGTLAKPLTPGSSEQATGWKCGGLTGTFTCALSDTNQLTAHWGLNDGAHGDGPAVSSGCSLYGGGGYYFQCCFATTPPPTPPPVPAIVHPVHLQHGG